MDTVIPLRESAFVQFVAYMVTVIGTLFALSTMWYGDRVTSKQWVYLMHVPGGKWAWGIWFLASCLVVILALRREAYRTAAGGLLVSGLGALFIAIFYLIGPFFKSDLLTLGYWPWLLWMSVTFLLMAVNARPCIW